jgi:hypothetical protein
MTSTKKEEMLRQYSTHDDKIDVEDEDFKKMGRAFVWQGFAQALPWWALISSSCDIVFLGPKIKPQLYFVFAMSMLAFPTQLFYIKPKGSASRFCCFTFGSALEVSYVFQALCLIIVPLIFNGGMAD